MQIQRAPKWLAPLCLVAACVLLFALLHIAQGSSPFAPSAYNSYTRQAMQWRKGTIALDHDIPHLELALYDGRYWVSFPPVPAVPVFLLTFLFGERVPDTLLVQLYAVLACLAIYRFVMRVTARPVSSAVWAFLFLFGSSFLPLLQNGAVWYQAQALALLMIVLAVERMHAGRPTAALVLYALSVGCRPFDALYGPMLLLMFWRAGPHYPKPAREKLRLVSPGILLGLMIAGLYAWYNTVRFGNPLEFGHSYLPEFSFQGGTQFSVEHIARNARTFLFTLPFESTPEGTSLRQFGFSLLLANPIFVCLLLWAVLDTIRRSGPAIMYAVPVLAALHILLLLSHRTMGGFQYGARYAVDAMPWALVYLALRKPDGKPRVPPVPCAEYPLLALGLLMAAYGAVVIHLPF